MGRPIPLPIQRGAHDSFFVLLRDGDGNSTIREEFEKAGRQLELKVHDLRNAAPFSSDSNAPKVYSGQTVFVELDALMDDPSLEDIINHLDERGNHVGVCFVPFWIASATPPISDEMTVRCAIWNTQHSRFEDWCDARYLLSRILAEHHLGEPTNPAYVVASDAMRVWLRNVAERIGLEVVELTESIDWLAINHSTVFVEPEALSNPERSRVVRAAFERQSRLFQLQIVALSEKTDVRVAIREIGDEVVRGQLQKCSAFSLEQACSPEHRIAFALATGRSRRATMHLREGLSWLALLFTLLGVAAIGNLYVLGCVAISTHLSHPLATILSTIFVLLVAGYDWYIGGWRRLTVTVVPAVFGIAWLAGLLTPRPLLWCAFLLAGLDVVQAFSAPRTSERRPVQRALWVDLVSVGAIVAVVHGTLSIVPLSQSVTLILTSVAGFLLIQQLTAAATRREFCRVLFHTNPSDNRADDATEPFGEVRANPIVASVERTGAVVAAPSNQTDWRNVFISHKNDRDVASNASEYLARQLLSDETLIPFVDCLSIDVDSLWRLGIADALAHSGFFILVLTKNKSDRWIIHELEVAACLQAYSDVPVVLTLEIDRHLEHLRISPRARRAVQRRFNVDSGDYPTCIREDIVPYLRCALLDLQHPIRFRGLPIFAERCIRLVYWLLWACFPFAVMVVAWAVGHGGPREVSWLEQVSLFTLMAVSGYQCLPNVLDAWLPAPRHTGLLSRYPRIQAANQRILGKAWTVIIWTGSAAVVTRYLFVAEQPWTIAAWAIGGLLLNALTPWFMPTRWWWIDKLSSVLPRGVYG